MLITKAKEFPSLNPFYKAHQAYQDLTEDAKDGKKTDARESAAIMALAGIGEKEFLGQTVSTEKISFLQRLKYGFDSLLEKLTLQFNPTKPLPTELKTALAQTQEGQTWIKQNQANKLKGALKAAFKNGPSPSIFNRYGDLIRYVDVGNKIITITRPMAGTGQNRNFKISASVHGLVNGTDVKAVISNAGKDQPLFEQLENFFKQDDAIETLETQELASPSLKGLQTIFQWGTIVNADLIKGNPDEYGNPIDHIELCLEYNDQLHYFNLRYKHPENDPYTGHIYEITDDRNREFKNDDNDTPARKLCDIAEDYMLTKLKEFNDDYLIEW